MYLWRAVDDEGEVLDVLVQAKRDKDAALRLMRKLLKNQGLEPASIVTDRYRAYDAALRDLGFSRIHHRGKRLNNRAESSHVPIRRRERKMQGFRSVGSAQRFLSSYSARYNTCNVCHHQTTASTHRILHGEAFAAWNTAVAASA
jgi:putative transposase